jgi:cytochrome P450
MAKVAGITQWLPLPYGPFRAFSHDPLTFQLMARARFGDVIRFRFGPFLFHFLYHPDHVRRVLHDHPKNYLRGREYRIISRVFGDGLTLSEGDYWRRQRRLAQPAFLRQRLAQYAEVMIDSTAQLRASWRVAASSGQAIDIAPEMSRLALAIAGRTFFSQDVSQETHAVGREFTVIGDYLNYRLQRPFTSLPLWVPTTRNRRFKAVVRKVNEIVMAVVKERRQHGGQHGDLLSMLMQARDEETGEAMTDDQLRAEVTAFLFAGHETTAVALTWTWYLLGSHASIRHWVRREVREVVGDRTPGVEDVAQLHSTRMVIEESMRMYPPIWGFPRRVVADDEIGGFRIPGGSTVLLSQFITHRHPNVWPDADVFDPERFTPERAAQRPKGAYFPFLGGPHQCIGNEFAMLEMCLIVAMVLQEFDLELLPDQAIRPLPMVTLRPNGPVRMALHLVDRGAHHWPVMSS